MIGIHKIGRHLPDHLSRINSKVGADTMPFEVMSLFKRNNIDYKVVNDVFELFDFDTSIIVSGVSDVNERIYERLGKVSNIIYLIDDPKLIQEPLVNSSSIVMEPSYEILNLQNGRFFPPELWAASYSFSMRSPAIPRPYRLMYWGSDTGFGKADRLEKYFPKHSITNKDDVLYLKSQKYGFDSRVGIDLLEKTRGMSKFTICVNDDVLTKRDYFNGRIYEAIVSGIFPIADLYYGVYGKFVDVPLVVDNFMLEKVLNETSELQRIDKVLELQEWYKDRIPKVEDKFLEVIL